MWGEKEQRDRHQIAQASAITSKNTVKATFTVNGYISLCLTDCDAMFISSIYLKKKRIKILLPKQTWQINPTMQCGMMSTLKSYSWAASHFFSCV